MSLFPAYSTGDPEDSVPAIQSSVAPPQAPSWLNNTSFKDFQDNVNRKQPIEISSDSEEERTEKRVKKNKKSKHSIVISSSDDSDGNSRKTKKNIRTRSKSREKDSYSRRRSKSRRRRSSRSRSRSRKRRSRSRSRKRYSRSRSPTKKSRKRSPEKSREEIIANSKFSSKKVFIEEVGVSLANAFREDKKGDRTNFGGSGIYAKDVAKYKTKLRYPLGNTKKQRYIKMLDENPRFHHKSYVKQVLKYKNVVKANKENITRGEDDFKSDFFKPYLSFNFNVSRIKTETVEDKSFNPLGIYSEATENYLKGVGGLEKEETEVFENDEIQQKRLEYNTKLRQSPGNVDLWMEFIDFQDEALKETVFQLNDEKVPKKSRRKNGEILRAKALTERKLAICKSAIKEHSLHRPGS